MGIEKLFTLFFINKVKLNPATVDKNTYSNYIHFISELNTLPKPWLENICQESFYSSDKNCSFLNYIKKNA